MADYLRDADGDALRRVAADGSDMSRPMEVDYVVDAGSAASGIAAAAQRLGHRTKVVENDS